MRGETGFYDISHDQQEMEEEWETSLELSHICSHVLVS